MKFRWKIFLIKIGSWEYWPMWLVYFPVGFYYVYLSLKARSLFFFSAANPSIEMGGMFFESKWKIFQLIPRKYYPPTILVESTDTAVIIENKMTAMEMAFPVIAKPNRGERGWGVKKINDTEELQSYRNQTRLEFLIQKYIDDPIELSVFYYRHPAYEKGKITSVTLKKLLTVRGDGESTVKQLILKSDRAILQYKKLEATQDIDMTRVPEKGEEQILVPYGNHVLGATFIDYQEIIDEQLCNTFDEISREIKGFYFGRFDLRCKSLEELKNGKGVSILELNGSGAEPAHIYDPSFSYFKAQKVLARHYRMMFEAAEQNRKSGVEYISYRDFRNAKTAESKYKLNYNIL